MLSREQLKDHANGMGLSVLSTLVQPRSPLRTAWKRSQGAIRENDRLLHWRINRYLQPDNNWVTLPRHPEATYTDRKTWRHDIIAIDRSERWQLKPGDRVGVAYILGSVAMLGRSSSEVLRPLKVSIEPDEMVEGPHGIIVDTGPGQNTIALIKINHAMRTLEALPTKEIAQGLVRLDETGLIRVI